jgi:hypothetical protein
MGAISSLVDAWDMVAKTARLVANIGRPQLIKQLDVLRLNLEQFKEAAREDDVPKMHQLLAECEEASKSLENRLFKNLDDKTNKRLNKTIRRARMMKSRMTRRTRAPTPAYRTIQRALNAKSAQLAGAIASNDESSRQKLLTEIDTAIGRLLGISKSLESFNL